MSVAPDVVFAERRRIREAYKRREAIAGEKYAPWQPAEEFMRAGRRRRAMELLRREGVFPREGDRCLEIGCGALGWLADVISWGVSARDLHGIDLDAARVASGREKLPGADLRVGDAASLPWPPASFRLAIASTVFSSVLDARVRSAIAEEIVRVLAPGGALIFYDLAVGNPKNPDVLPVPRRDLARLFPTLSVRAVSATLAPPLARAVAPRSVALAHLLEAVPFLRTHVLAILVKRRDA
ncbi:MAG TPA: class I SAM-dependent methyltransferase [Thermoanaerobaculia bacterium]|nr:class I SAM-dependent methyltransferase [Thermoanaerobaculia bacterium]